jgi:hypothetical protein
MDTLQSTGYLKDPTMLVTLTSFSPLLLKARTNSTTSPTVNTFEKLGYYQWNHVLFSADSGKMELTET